MNEKSRPTFEEVDSDEDVEETTQNPTYENTEGGNEEEDENSSTSNNEDRFRQNFFRPRGFGDIFSGDSFFSDSGFGRGGMGMGSKFSNMDMDMDMNMGGGGGGGGTTQFYSSSSTSTSVNGVTQTTKRTKDSSGKEKLMISRQIGDKKITIEKKKESDGSEETTKRTENLEESEFNDFDSAFNDGLFQLTGNRGSGRRNNGEQMQSIEGRKKKKKKRRGKK